MLKLREELTRYTSATPNYPSEWQDLAAIDASRSAAVRKLLDVRCQYGELIDALHAYAAGLITAQEAVDKMLLVSIR